MKTELYDHHQKLGAKFIDFSGYTLPVWFSSLRDEHFAVRDDSGVFDISHMGALKITGADSARALQLIVCSDIQKSKGRKMVYSMVLNESAGIIDDVMFGDLGNGEWLLVVNASNKSTVQNWLNNQASTMKFECTDLNNEHVFLAVQGPNSWGNIQNLFDNTLNLNRFDLGRSTLFNESVIVSRTGYTGEDGVELLIPKAIAAKTYQALLALSVQPCGLGARDSLRMEAGLPLYGQDLSASIVPFQTRYQWVVSESVEFIGKKALDQFKLNSDTLVMVGLKLESGIARSGYEIIEGGWVTSGTKSPYLDTSIAIAYVPKRLAIIDQNLTIKVRTRDVRARVVNLPFYKK